MKSTASTRQKGNRRKLILSSLQNAYMYAWRAGGKSQGVIDKGNGRRSGAVFRGSNTLNHQFLPSTDSD